MKHLMFGLVMVAALLLACQNAHAQCYHTSYYAPVSAYYAPATVYYPPAYNFYSGPSYWSGYRGYTYAPRSVMYYGW